MNENQHEHEELTRAVEPEVQKMTAIQRITAVFAAPTELAKNIKAYPVVGIPLLLVMILNLAPVPISAPYTAMLFEEQQNIMIERAIELGHDPARLGFAQAGADFYGDANPIAGINMNFLAIVNAIIGVPILAILGTLAIWVLTKITKGKATFAQNFSLYLHSMILVSLGSIVSISIMLATGSLLDMTSLAAFIMPHGNMSNMMFNALQLTNIFNVWATIIIFIGVKVLNECTAKAAIITSVYFIGYIALLSWLAAMPYSDNSINAIIAFS